MNDNKKTQIIIDSTTDLAEGFRDRVMVVPLMVSFGEKEYIDGIELSRDEFYRKLETEDVIPKTSQASPAAFESVYREVREKGMICPEPIRVHALQRQITRKYGLLIQKM